MRKELDQFFESLFLELDKLVSQKHKRTKLLGLFATLSPRQEDSDVTLRGEFCLRYQGSQLHAKELLRELPYFRYVSNLGISNRLIVDNEYHRWDTTYHKWLDLRRSGRVHLYGNASYSSVYASLLPEHLSSNSVERAFILDSMKGKQSVYYSRTIETEESILLSKDIDDRYSLYIDEISKELETH